MNRKTLYIEAMVGALSLFALVSCGKKDNPITVPDKTQLMIVHASPDTPDIQVSIDDQQLVNNLAFRHATPYMTVNPGKHDVKIADAGVANGLIYEDSITFDAGYVSMITTNLVDSLKVITIDDRIVPPGNTSMGLRFANLSPNAGPTNFVISTPENDSLTFKSIPFGEVTSFQDFQGSIKDNLEVRSAATDSVLVGVISDSNRLQDGGLYTIYLTGLKGDQNSPERLDLTIIQND